MGLDGARRKRQRARDLLVGEPGDDETQHLALALGQLLAALAGGLVGLRAFARIDVPAHRLLQRLEQLFVVDRLLEELRGAGLEGAPAHLHRAMAGEHDHRLVDALRPPAHRAG